MLKDIIDIASIIHKNKGTDTGVGLPNGKKALKMVAAPKRSISRLAMDAMASFSVIVDDQCTVDEGMVICRNLEKRFASFLLISMAMDPKFKLASDQTLADYVKKFHQNLNVDDSIAGNFGGTKFSMENVTVEQLAELAESIGVEYMVFATESTVDILHTIYEGVNSSAINKAASRLNFTIEDVTEQNTINSVGTKRLLPTTEASGSSGSGKGQSKESSFVNTKFEKANDSVPTLLHIAINVAGIEGPVDFIIGVKATLHPLSQTNIMLNLVRGLRNDDKFFNFIRWTTGETKFVKDFLLCVDQLKLEAVTSVGSNNALFNMSKRRKELSTIRNRFFKNNLMPNLSLIVTTDCLQRIKDEYGYDITLGGGSSQVALVRKLMNSYFMLGFVIVDQNLDRAHFLIDGETAFESYTFTNLQREGTTNDKQFKEMMKMLGRSV